ncbi:hypothetical protein [Desulfogranum japonicum]|uniref:hypothetical protein n=1 Tax=Desulfogranum japonicum TaxID=231447 RepID=UPI0004208F21|nr:hypothetical protein [Desulfogranum japonicum]
METEKVQPEKNEYCAACGMEMDLSEAGLYIIGEEMFCSWCWSNDCCRISRDAAERERVSVNRVGKTTV